MARGTEEEIEKLTNTLATGSAGTSKMIVHRSPITYGLVPVDSQKGRLDFDTMVQDSNTGEVNSLQCYFNKHLLSVDDLNTLMGIPPMQGKAVPEEEELLESDQGNPEPGIGSKAKDAKH